MLTLAKPLRVVFNVWYEHKTSLPQKDCMHLPAKRKVSFFIWQRKLSALRRVLGQALSREIQGDPACH